MKRFLLIKSLLLLFALVVGSTSVWADTYVESTSFDETSGNVGNDTNVTFTSYQGGGTSAPALNGGCIRLYQKTGGGLGGYIVIGVPENHVITDIYNPQCSHKSGLYVDRY